MNTFDVFGGVELTASAAIMVAVVTLVFGRDQTTRLRLAVAMALWFAVVVILAATGVLGNERGIGVGGVGLAVLIPIVALSATLLRAPSLRQGLERAPLSILTAVHAVRILGISFLILRAQSRLPAPFAPVAGWGDILVGVFALPVAWLVARQAPAWRAALWTWNLLSLADLVTAITLGVLSSPGPLRAIFSEPGSGIMSSLPWLLIPGFLVPLLVTIHLAIFYRLIRAAREHTLPLWDQHPRATA